MVSNPQQGQHRSRSIFDFSATVHKALEASRNTKVANSGGKGGENLKSQKPKVTIYSTPNQGIEELRNQEGNKLKKRKSVQDHTNTNVINVKIEDQPMYQASAEGQLSAEKAKENAHEIEALDVNELLLVPNKHMETKKSSHPPSPRYLAVPKISEDSETSHDSEQEFEELEKNILKISTAVDNLATADLLKGGDWSPEAERGAEVALAGIAPEPLTAWKLGPLLRSRKLDSCYEPNDSFSSWSQNAFA